MSGPLFNVGASASKLLRTSAGVRPVGHHGWRMLSAPVIFLKSFVGSSNQAGRIHQENLSHLNSANSPLQINKLMLEVDKKLAHVANEARQMGRSFSLLVAIKNLRQQLVSIELLTSSKSGPIDRFSREDEPDEHSPYPLPKRRSADMFSFAQALEMFRKCIQDFREYDDEMINMKGALRELSSDIKYWACSLDSYAQSDSLITEDYANQIMNELKNRIAKMASNLQLFTEIGMPAIRYEQNRSGAVLLALSTGATFFSGVTATMLQISYSVMANAGTMIANTFWFCSLVLSIGAAINSLLAMVWKQTFHGSRGSDLPRWLTWWINGSPPIFLFLSIICFSAGIVIFVFFSKQSPFTSWFTLAATAVTSSAFSANILWMLHEQIAAWVSPTQPPTDSPNLDEKAPGRNGKSFYRQRIKSLGSLGLPVYDKEQVGRASARPRIDMPRNFFGYEPAVATISPSHVTDVRRPLPSDPRNSPKIEHTQGEGKGSIGLKLVCYGDLKAFGALRDFKRSPDGRYLATTSWNAATTTSTTIVFSEMDKYEFGSHQVFETAIKSSPGPRQLIWSYDSAHLLIRYDKIIDIWSLEPRQLRRIARYDAIQSVRWYEQEQAFLCITKHAVYKLGLGGKEIWGRSCNDIFLYDASVASNGRLLLLGHVPSFQGDLKPSHQSVAEKQIRVYQTEDDKKVTNASQRKLGSSSMPRVPILDDVNHITPTNNKDEFLISYRSQKPPQIWSLSDSLESPRLKLEISYQSTFKDEFEGVSYASRDCSDDLVISTGRAGDVHLWSSKDGKRIHRFHVGGGSFMSAWLSGADGTIRFATANAGGVSIWQFGGREVKRDPEKHQPIPV